MFNVNDTVRWKKDASSFIPDYTPGIITPRFYFDISPVRTYPCDERWFGYNVYIGKGRVVRALGYQLERHTIKTGNCADCKALLLASDNVTYCNTCIWKHDQSLVELRKVWSKCSFCGSSNGLFGSELNQHNPQCIWYGPANDYTCLKQKGKVTL